AGRFRRLACASCRSLCSPPEFELLFTIGAPLMTEPSAHADHHGPDPGSPPRIPYWHVWTDEQGVSRQTRCSAGDFVSKSISPPAVPQWQDQLAAGEAIVLLTVQPVGWTAKWHENPKPQWI